MSSLLSVRGIQAKPLEIFALETGSAEYDKELLKLNLWLLELIYSIQSQINFLVFMLDAENDSWTWAFVMFAN